MSDSEYDYDILVEIRDFLLDFPINFKKINGEIELHKRDEKNIVIQFELDVINKIINVYYITNSISNKLKFYIVHDPADNENISVDGDFEEYIKSVVDIAKCDNSYHSIHYRIDNLPSCTTNIVNYKKCEDKFLKNIKFMVDSARVSIATISSLYRYYMKSDAFNTKGAFERILKRETGFSKEVLERCMHIKFKSS
jgi:hypothetical protein